MKIEAGKSYRTRGGDRVKIISYDIHYDYPCCGCNNVSYTSLGTEFYHGESVNDLIAEWTDTPEVGTLQEIGAQVGDVVECVGNTGAHGSLQLGREYEVAQSGLVIDEQGDEYDWITPKFRIISRANQGPVREVTTVRKEIVSGQYGIIDLSGVDKDMVQIRMIAPRLLKTWFTADELTAAISTLQTIRDAMQANTTT